MPPNVVFPALEVKLVPEKTYFMCNFIDLFDYCGLVFTHGTLHIGGVEGHAMTKFYNL
jgi:hypothetical protein